MMIDPFWAGVLSTIFIELITLFILALVKTKK